jgi:hypothetical protein
VLRTSKNLRVKTTGGHERRVEEEPLERRKKRFSWVI